MSELSEKQRDSLDEDQVDRTRKWLRLDPHYRTALTALGGRDG